MSPVSLGKALSLHSVDNLKQSAALQIFSKIISPVNFLPGHMIQTHQKETSRRDNLKASTHGRMDVEVTVHSAPFEVAQIYS